MSSVLAQRHYFDILYIFCVRFGSQLFGEDLWIRDLLAAGGGVEPLFVDNKKFIAPEPFIGLSRNFTGKSVLILTFRMFGSKANFAPKIQKNLIASKLICRKAFSGIVGQGSKWHNSLNFYLINPVLLPFFPKICWLRFIFRPRVWIWIKRLSFSMFFEGCEWNFA